MAADKKKKKKTGTTRDPQGNIRWKPPVYLYAAFICLAVYFALETAAVWEEDDTLFSGGAKVLAEIEKNPVPDFGAAFENVLMFFRILFVFLVIVGLYILFDLTKNRNFMVGREYGTASWATPEQINRKFENREETSYNRVYSEKIRISMKNPINNNALVIGGSGVGKSKFLLTPNIYQANADSRYPGSMIFTDPKGELLRDNGRILREKGYVIKVLNLVPGLLQESDGFNPFPYAPL